MTFILLSLALAVIQHPTLLLATELEECFDRCCATGSGTITAILMASSTVRPPMIAWSADLSIPSSPPECSATTSFITLSSAMECSALTSYITISASADISYLTVSASAETVTES